tara:strand:+ start:1837 stop:2094 length:258 start_codon:yes stop_codon:yes gene_type:complete
MESELDFSKKYIATYEYVHFVVTKENCSIPDHTKRKVFTTQQTYSGYPHDIALAVKYYMGHYGAIQGKLLGEMNEITNKEDRVWS